MNPFYQEVTALNREQHKNFKLKQTSNCGFAKNMHLVPLAGVEFFQASSHYSIVFVGEGANTVPVALLGLTADENGFVNSDNQWEENCYVPAFIRRYPFVLAEDKNDNFTVCIDSAYDGWNEKEGQPLFNTDGKNSEFLDEMIRFLQNFSHEMTRTRQFVEKLQELDLLHVRSMQLKHSSGETFLLSDFRTVNEEKFLQLKDKQILDLHKQGFLGFIYAHLISQSNAGQLFSRYLRTKNLPDNSNKAKKSAKSAK